jgi:hypothetical protein
MHSTPIGPTGAAMEKPMIKPFKMNEKSCMRAPHYHSLRHCERFRRKAAGKASAKQSPDR